MAPKKKKPAYKLHHETQWLLHATQQDIKEAFKLHEEVSQIQEKLVDTGEHCTIADTTTARIERINS